MYQQIISFGQNVSESLVKYFNAGYELTGQIVDRAISPIRNFPNVMQANRYVAVAVFLVPSAVVFYFCNRKTQEWDQRFNDKPLTRRWVFKHIALNAAVAGPAVAVNYVVSKMTEYALTKEIYLAIAVASIALRYLLSLVSGKTKAENGKDEVKTGSETETDLSPRTRVKKQELERQIKQLRSEQTRQHDLDEIEKLNQKQVKDGREKVAKALEEKRKKDEEEARAKKEKEANSAEDPPGSDAKDAEGTANTSGTKETEAPEQTEEEVRLAGEQAKRQDTEAAEKQAKEKAKLENAEIDAAERKREEEEQVLKDRIEQAKREEAEKKAKADEAERARQREIANARRAKEQLLREIIDTAKVARKVAADQMEVRPFEFFIIEKSGGYDESKFLIICQTNGDYQALNEKLEWSEELNKKCCFDRVGNESLYTGMTSVILRMRNENPQEFQDILSLLRRLSKKGAADRVKTIMREKMDADLDAQEAKRKAEVPSMATPRFTFTVIPKKSAEEEDRILVTCDSNEDLRKLKDKLTYCSPLDKHCVYDIVGGQSVHTGARQFIIRASLAQQRFNAVKEENRITLKDLIDTLEKDLKGIKGDEIIQDFPIAQGTASHYVNIYGNLHEKRIAQLKLERGYID